MQARWLSWALLWLVAKNEDALRGLLERSPLKLPQELKVYE
jgi:hypothetical protein